MRRVRPGAIAHRAAASNAVHGREGQVDFRQKGFTLFEMVVVICLIVMLYTLAQQRVSEMPAAAERASFHAVLAQLKAGVNLAMLGSLSRGDWGRLQSMEGANPMEFLLETPANYRGELEASMDLAVLPRASWYYVRSSGELLYLVGEANVPNVSVLIGGRPVNMGQLRLKVMRARGGQNNRTLAAVGGQGASAGRWQGLLLIPVMPYEWEGRLASPAGI